MKHMSKTAAAALAVAGVWSLLPARPAAASFHTFCIEEVFSTLDGTVQFVELVETEGMNGQGHFSEGLMTSNKTYYEFPNDLPGEQSAFRHVLIATPKFTQMCRDVLPDYFMPPGFISIKGDTIALRLTMDGKPTTELTFKRGELPTDGVMSLLADGSTAPNSPTNYWWQTCSLNAVGVPTMSEWGLLAMSAVLLPAGVAVILGRARRRRTT